MKPLTLLAPLLLLAAVPAQDKTTTAAPKATSFRFVPADATIVARIAAPAKWRELFAATHFPKLLASDTVAPWLAELQKEVDKQAEDVRREGHVDVDLLQKLFHEYRGEVVVAITVDIAALATHEGDGPPPFAGSITLTPDGSSDLAALAATVAKLAEENEGRPLRDVTIGDHKLRMTDDSLDMDGTLPVVIDGHLVMLFGQDLEKAGARMLDSTNRMAVAGDGKGLWVHAELQELANALIAKLGTSLEAEGAPFEVEPLLRSLGLGAIEDATIAIGPAGKHGQIEFTLGTAEKDRGLLDVFPADQAGVKLLRRLPAGAESFSAMTLDIGALFTLVAKTWQSLGDEVPLSWDDAMAGFTESMKVRLKEDVIDHLGKGFMMIEDIDMKLDADTVAASEEDNVAAAARGCYVLSLRDGKAFGTALEQMLRARGLHAARKSEDYQGEKIWQLRLAGLVELEYVVTSDMLLVALGRDEAARAHLRGVLDAARQGNTTELPKAAVEHVAVLPPGYTALTVTPVGDTLRNLATMAITMAERGHAIPDDGAGVLQAMGDLGKEMIRLGMGTMVGATYIEPRRIRMVSQW